MANPRNQYLIFVFGTAATLVECRMVNRLYILYQDVCVCVKLQIWRRRESSVAFSYLL